MRRVKWELGEDFVFGVVGVEVASLGDAGAGRPLRALSDLWFACGRDEDLSEWGQAMEAAIARAAGPEWSRTEDGFFRLDRPGDAAGPGFDEVPADLAEALGHLARAGDSAVQALRAAGVFEKVSCGRRRAGGRAGWCSTALLIEAGPKLRAEREAQALFEAAEGGRGDGARRL